MDALTSETRAIVPVLTIRNRFGSWMHGRQYIEKTYLSSSQIRKLKARQSFSLSVSILTLAVNFSLKLF
jgi:hypothetical protein